MAKPIEAFSKFGPKIKLNSLLPPRDLEEWIGMRTGKTAGEVALMLHELKAAIIYFNRRGTPVKLPGLGLFSPSISREGKYRINVRIDNALRKGINADDAFNGRVINRGNIGLDNESFKAMWDEAYPEDPLEL